MKNGLKKVCERAMREGLKIDLTGCDYGKTAGPCAFLKRPTNYYYFLAGLVRSKKLRRILEIGTHFGGSIMSMARGLRGRDMLKSKLVTVDIERKNADGFRQHPYIARITGDSLDENIVKKVQRHFNGPLDLIYIDSIHEYDHTMRNIEIYAKPLDPRYIALDDIRQCDSMKELWSALTREFKENAFDASEISLRKGAGFGMIKWRGGASREV